MLPLAVTMGEPAGIGGDLVLAAWARRGTSARHPFFAIDDADRLRALALRLELPVPIDIIADPTEAADVFDRALPVLHRPLSSPVVPGHPDSAHCGAVIAAIEEAVRLARAGRISGVVTNPIHKAVMQDSGFAFPGHTEFLAHLAGGVPVAMMLASADLKVVPVTIHRALKEAIASLSTQAIIDTGGLLAEALRRDFGLTAPRIVIAGLNPHAGEDGTMGREDIDIIRPAVIALQNQGVDACGPLSPDAMFHAEARAGYDAALCMYHDQALIPLKTLDFFGGVNITLGLPFIRTSPDHGTAFAIAGTGRARPDSLIAALACAAEMAARRAAA